jgi:hypothetical protein
MEKSAPKIQHRGSKTSSAHTAIRLPGEPGGVRPRAPPALIQIFCGYLYLSHVYPLTTAVLFCAPKLDFSLDKHNIQTVKASTIFHSKLAYTNTLMFSNSLIAKITDESTKNATISEVAKIIAKCDFERKDSD